ncbi:hypothetical protein [Methylobacterium haplocladii]|uniref:Uncharacterized protein n=1 Tax=Methylobacterium haplocladii TaxID=1176176 RepID=A0A512IQV6_9HYPH|nr:hypothetical protein [Methylobacterium haplocladii]GEP00104.1 hypothetical protein MHA02_24910 [Methylobacterium haplocladii]GJD85356.1 hypothetical protein HPGCJGGD_3244 [Methylobacterium haplocladii]GLS58152.1 hypothetical protein GCM10007887_08080 [Methylobacterium haplocladii]
MLSRNLRPPGLGYNAVDQDVDRLIVRIHRLAAHRGYDREALVSPMLKRLMPTKRPSGDPVAETAALRTRLKESGIDSKAVAYLTASVENELDFARLRLT